METTKRELNRALVELEKIGKFEILHSSDERYKNLEWVEEQHEKFLHVLVHLDTVLHAGSKVYINMNNWESRDHISFAIDGERLYIYTVYGFVRNNNLKKFWDNLMLHLGFLIGCEKELKNLKN